MALLESILHITFLGVYIFVAYSFLSIIEINTKSSEPNLKRLGDLTSRFLTNWTYGVQLLYYAFMVLAHLLHVLPFLQKASNKLKSFADLLFTTIVIPYGLVVTITFWSLFTMDRELVYPKWLDGVIPLWVNHALHTSNSVLPLIDMILCNHQFHPWALSFSCILFYSLAYGVCFFGTYYTQGIWLYPMFEKLSLPETVLYSFGNLGLAFLLHAIARFINNLIRGPPTEKTKKKKNKQNKQQQKTKKVA